MQTEGEIAGAHAGARAGPVRVFDPTVTFEGLAWIKEQWPNKLVVKGIQTLEDARAVVDLDVDGIVLSNHGGRQLDRAPVPFHLLPRVAGELSGATEILLDTCIMSGADIVAPVALGARFTLVGRAYLYGLMAGGRLASTGRSKSCPGRSAALCGCSASPVWRSWRRDMRPSCFVSDRACRNPDVLSQL